VVELGTHYGVSFFAFCEAAEAFSSDTFVYAVDTWMGDEHAGLYGEEVFEQVRHHQQLHHSLRSCLIRSSFDTAATHFGEETIDLLHIDGMHTYDDVKHDLATWRSRLRPGGTILFHDINVRERDFGVWRLWREIRGDPSFRCVALLNGHGLGIATLNTTSPAWHGELLSVVRALSSKGVLLNDLAQRTSEATAARVKEERCQQQVLAADAKAEMARTMLQEVLHSTSWRLTAPLRRMLGGVDPPQSNS
jgi:predicted O-methyltransferase YrrM